MKKDGIKLSRKCLENDLWCLQEAMRLNLSETTIRKLADIAQIQKMMFNRAMQRHQRKSRIRAKTADNLPTLETAGRLLAAF